uniref:Splicing factor, arginine/serine-rich 15-like n=1 Tax=Sinocyclocheilus rhinocerous TaxID=307959 RepID=A0A673I7E3_9TELE
MDMEAVNAFNGEMMSMMDMTPPISRAKMMSVTKAGIKAIKLYKHVVQIVEKFIKRCKPDLKVAGLYVVDSIIRQSRHQFSTDKDVFGPRFLKNFTLTFQNLFQCPADDKGKILRVLNLWQKNDVFSMDIIQPLLDMATDSVLPVVENGIPAPVKLQFSSFFVAPPAMPMAVPEPEPAPAPAVAAAPPTLQNPVALAAVAQLLQGTGGVEQLLQTLQQAGGAGLPQSTAPPPEQKTSLAKSLLDRFDYDDDPEPVEEKTEPAPAAPITINLPPELQQALQAHLLSQIVSQDMTKIMYAIKWFLPVQTQMQGQMVSQSQVASQGQVAPHEFPVIVQTQIPDNTPQVFDESVIQPSTTQQLQQVWDCRLIFEWCVFPRSPRRRSSSRSRRSRSGSRSRRERSRYHRTRSRSRERRGRSPQARSEERRDREKERERRQKGLPPVKKETLSVCSTTLWIGQLDKKTQQQDIMSLMEEFGQIESINVCIDQSYQCTSLLKSLGSTQYFYLFREDWKSFVANPAVPVTEGPEGKQEDGAALPAVSQVKYEGFPTELLKGVQCLGQFFCSHLFTSSTYGRQTMFLCSLLCTDALLVQGCHHFWQVKSHRAQNKTRLVS